MSAHSHLIAADADDLAARHPVEEGRVRPHKTLDGEAFKIRTLVMDAAAVMREHRAPVPILVQVVSGRLLFRVEGEEHELRTGGSIQVDAGVPHELEAVEPTHLLLVLMG